MKERAYNKGTQRDRDRAQAGMQAAKQADKQTDIQQIEWQSKIQPEIKEDTHKKKYNWISLPSFTYVSQFWLEQAVTLLSRYLFAQAKMQCISYATGTSQQQGIYLLSVPVRMFGLHLQC